MPGILLQPGRNCQRIDHAHKAAVIVDADDYFKALDQALDLARQSVFIVGWEIDSKLPLLLETGKPPQHFLGERLNQTAARDDVQVYILTWDFASVFLLERQFMPVFDLGWASHQRMRFAMDAEHPLGGSHHQKIVVIDDALAFVGGMDLTRRRWDTKRHSMDEEHRVDPAGVPYPPAHDIQMAVNGDAARALGELVRERWRRCTGTLPPTSPKTRSIWPENLVSDLDNVQVALARTEPAYKGRPEVREVEALFLDSIAAAKHCIYIENQYFTSLSIFKALAARLREPDGPEAIIILPKNPVGWLEENIMGALGAKVLEGLRQSDIHGRLKIYYPVAPGTTDGYIKVHSKLMIVDDWFLRVGSANLNNRSMGLDTECDLAVEAGGDESLAGAIAAVRTRLAAEHLQVPPEALSTVHRSGRGLLEAMAALSGEPLPRPPVREWNWKPAPDQSLELALTLDPEKPIEMDRLMDEFIGQERRAGKGLRSLMLVLAALSVLALSWRFTPLHDVVSLENLAAWFGFLRIGPYTPLVMLGVYLGSSLVFLPISLLLAATAVAFPPAQGVAYSIGGCLAASALNYWLGAALGRKTVRRLTGKSLNRFSRYLAKMGFLSIILVRIVPIAPFTVINLAAGASRITFLHFIAGTLLGMAPGILMLNVFASQLKEAILRPGWFNLGVIAVAAGLFTVLVMRISRRIQREDNQESDGPIAKP